MIDVELEAGDALFFHSNVLHKSDQNNSDRRRWAFIMSYNMASNDPVLPHHHPQYTPLIKVREKGGRMMLCFLRSEMKRYWHVIAQI